jgi:hypothetical protein
MKFQEIYDKFENGGYTEKQELYESQNTDRIFDTDKSVKWNKEQAEKVNQETKLKNVEIKDYNAQIFKKFEDDLFDMFMAYSWISYDGVKAAIELVVDNGSQDYWADQNKDYGRPIYKSRIDAIIDWTRNLINIFEPNSI